MKHYYFDTTDTSISSLNAPLETQAGAHFTTAEELVASDVPDEELLKWYNVDNDSPVEAFENRQAAAEAIFKMLQDAEPPVQGSVVSGTGAVAPTKAEQAAAAKAAKDAEKEAAKVAKAEAKVKSDEAKAKAKSEKEASKASAKAAKGEAKASSGTSAPRTSKLAGATLFHTIAPTAVEGSAPEVVNPRQAGSFGHHSLGLIIAAGDAGIKYEDFIAGGGRSKDLNWDVDHGWARIAPAAA